MSVVPKTQVSLTRRRRELKALMEQGQWSDVINMETDLFAEMDLAVQDPERSPKALLNELGSVIRVYRELSDLCSSYAQHPCGAQKKE